jgi:hypothetical protein
MIHFQRAHLPRIFAALVLLLSSAWAAAQGGPPLVTDDPGTPGDGKWEINLGLIGSKTAHAWNIDALDADMNYGLGDNIQLKLDIPWSYAHESGGAWYSGIGSVDAGVKWRFLDRDENSEGGLAVSTYPQLLSAWSNYSKRTGVATANKQFYLPVEFATAAAGFEFAGEFGRNFVQNEDDQWQAGIIASHGCGSEALDCLIEVHQTWVPHDSQTLLNFGIHYKIHENLIFLAAAGREFGPRTDDQQRFLYYAGFQILR